MDHSHHHQASMVADPPMHHGHEGHDMPGMSMCSMNMIFNWDIKDVCIVFESWHIETWVGMAVSCAVIFAIAAGYEYLSAWTTTLDRNLARRNGKRHASPSTSEPNEHDALLSASSLSKRDRILRSVMYAVLMGISFWLMLVFMTYNGYLMIALVLGAGVGHYVFGQGKPAARSISCH